jgi:hypothetical protein
VFAYWDVAEVGGVGLDFLSMSRNLASRSGTSFLMSWVGGVNVVSGGGWGVGLAKSF